MAWKSKFDKLTATGDTLQVDPDGEKFIEAIAHELNSGSINPKMTFNGDTGTNYARRRSENGAVDATSVSRIDIDHDVDTTESLMVGSIIDIATEEKLAIIHTCNLNAAGAGSAPNRGEYVGKHAQTTNPITQLNDNNLGAGDYIADTLLVGIETND